MAVLSQLWRFAGENADAASISVTDQSSAMNSQLVPGHGTQSTAASMRFLGGHSHPVENSAVTIPELGKATVVLDVHLSRGANVTKATCCLDRVLRPNVK